MLFKVSLKMEQLLHNLASSQKVSSAESITGIKVSKIRVLSFNAGTSWTGLPFGNNSRSQYILKITCRMWRNWHTWGIKSRVTLLDTFLRTLTTRRKLYGTHWLPSRIIWSTAINTWSPHPHYLRSSFTKACQWQAAALHDHTKGIVKQNGVHVCMNCLRPGHFHKQCPLPKVVKNSKTHTILHFMLIPKSETWCDLVQNLYPRKSQLLFHLMPSNYIIITRFDIMCHVKVVCHNSSTMQARALLDSVLSASFIMELLAQCLCLMCHHHGVNISATSSQLSSPAAINFEIILASSSLAS